MSSDPTVAFPRALTAAIAASGKTLGMVTGELAERGLSVSNATLSYWCTGRSLPRRSTSLKAVRELERILGLDTGLLITALGGSAEASWRPTAVIPGTPLLDELHDRGFDLDRHATLSWQHELLHELSDDRVRVHSRCLFRAEESGLDRLALLVGHAVGASGIPAAVVEMGGTMDAPVLVGRGDRLPATWVCPVRLPRPLTPGESWQVEIVTEWDVTGPDRGLTLPLPTASRFLVLDGWPRGSAAVEHEVTLTEDGDQQATTVTPGTGGHVQVAREQAPSGLHLLRWRTSGPDAPVEAVRG